MEFDEVFEYCPRCGSAHFVKNDAKSKRCETCGFTYYNNAAAAVAAFILHNDKLLLCTRAQDPAKGTLDLPGGFIDIGETAEQAIAREIKEELNLEVASATYLFSVPNAYTYSEFDVHTLDIFFAVKITDLSLLKSADDVAEAHFFNLCEVDCSHIGLTSIRTAVERFLNEHKH